MQIFNYVKAFGKTSVDLLAAVDGIVDLIYANDTQFYCAMLNNGTALEP